MCFHEFHDCSHVSTLCFHVFESKQSTCFHVFHDCSRVSTVCPVLLEECFAYNIHVLSFGNTVAPSFFEKSMCFHVSSNASWSLVNIRNRSKEQQGTARFSKQVTTCFPIKRMGKHLNIKTQTRNIRNLRNMQNFTFDTNNEEPPQFQDKEPPLLFDKPYGNT